MRFRISNGYSHAEEFEAWDEKSMRIGLALAWQRWPDPKPWFLQLHAENPEQPGDWVDAGWPVCRFITVTQFGWDAAELAALIPKLEAGFREWNQFFGAVQDYACSGLREQTKLTVAENRDGTTD